MSTTPQPSFTWTIPNQTLPCLAINSMNVPFFFNFFLNKNTQRFIVLCASLQQRDAGGVVSMSLPVPVAVPEEINRAPSADLRHLCR